MPFCCNCGKEINETAKFCQFCGSPSVAQSKNQAETVRQVAYTGIVYKCPNCGEVMPSFTSICPACGIEIRGVETANSTNGLYAELQAATSDEKRILSVKMFPVPNSKEDIMEFMILAVSNFDADFYVTHKNEDSLSAAWLSKLEQCYQKAKVALKGSPELQEITTIYNDTKAKIEQAKAKDRNEKLIAIGSIALGLVLIMTTILIIQTMGLVILGAGIFMLCKKKTNSQQVQPANYSGNSIPVKTGFASWSTGAKVMWIILNIYTLGIPAIIYSSKRKKG